MPETEQTDARAKGFRPISLDAINFLLADVRGALGPYLNVFLVTRQHWSLSEVGLVTSVSGLIGLALQTPAGALIDWTRAKRGLVVAALAVLATGATVIALWPNFWPVLIANSLIAVVGDIFGPAIAALTLGLVARKQLARRTGRNSAFDHAGNVAIAALAGLVGWALSRAPSSSSCRSFPFLPRSPFCPFRRRPSTMRGRQRRRASQCHRQQSGRNHMTYRHRNISSDYTDSERFAREFVSVQSCFIVFKMRDFVQNCDTSTKELERRADFGALF